MTFYHFIEGLGPGPDDRARTLDCPSLSFLRDVEVTVTGGWSLGRLSATGTDHARSVGGPLLWAAANARGMSGYATGR